MIVGLRGGLAPGVDVPVQGCVARSKVVSIVNACSREAPHISSDGRRLPHTAGRCGEPNKRQPSCASSCTHATPAGLPLGMPGIGELIEGAMQQAAQPGRQESVEDIGTV